MLKVTLSEIHISAMCERISAEFGVPTLASRHLSGYKAALSMGDDIGNLVDWCWIETDIDVF